MHDSSLSLTPRVLVRVFVFLMAFTLEVRVKAAEVVSLPEAKFPLEEPLHCLKESSLCAVRTREGEKFEVHAGASSVVLDQGSSIIRVSSDEVRLVWGTIWVKAKGAFTVKTEYGDARVADGEFWMTRTAERIVISAVIGEVEISPRGAIEKIMVEPGEENWVSRVDATGVAETGLPKAIPFESHVARWARLYDGGKKSFEKDVEAFHRLWKAAGVRAAKLHSELMSRKIASIEEEKARREARRRRQAAEDRKYQEMLRRRVLDQEE